MSALKIAVFSLLIVAAGCTNKQAGATKGSASTAESVPEAKPALQEGKTATKEDPKTAADGMKHEPPIALDKVPDGHWYCDMGTSHYTQKNEGDGKCPLCGMALKHMDHAKMGHGDHENADGHHGGDEHHH